MRCIAFSPALPQFAPMLTKQIGANIQLARKAKGWSLEKLAAKVTPQTSYQQIGKLEKAERPISIEWVERIAAALDVDPMEILAPDLKADEPPVLHLDEQVATAAAESLATVALGEEPTPATVQAVALVLRQLVALFSKHPEAASDLRVARPAIALVGNRLAPEGH